jgi:hypothetical protein
LTWITKKEHDVPLVDNLEEGKALVTFDLNLPLKKQIEKAYQELQVKQEKLKYENQIKINNSNPQKEKWKEYLRIIDAKENGASNTEIARLLFPDTIGNKDYDNMRKDVHKKFRVARQFVEESFSSIASK